MRSRITLQLSLLALCALSVATCFDEAPPTAPAVPPTFAISDAAHGGPNLHFYFLPPLVPQPSYSGNFDATLSPTVTILEDGVLFATLTATLGDEFYHANWHTDQYVLDQAKTYRISVAVDGSELGFADVVVADNVGQLKNVITDENVPLKDGRTLPIKFRVEEGALGDDPVLYGIVGAGPSSLYIRDPLSGWIELGATGFLHKYVRGIDFAPNGTLYGIGEDFYGPHPSERVLIEIDAETAYGTEVGPTAASGFDTHWDISFRNNDGVLYALGRHAVADIQFCMGLGTVDLSTGLATELGSTNTCYGWPTPTKPAPLAFSNADALYFVEASDGTLYTLDQGTGSATSVVSLTFVDYSSGAWITSLDFHPVTGILYASVRSVGGYCLATVNTATGDVSCEEPLPEGTQAIAWR